METAIKITKTRRLVPRFIRDNIKGTPFPSFPGVFIRSLTRFPHFSDVLSSPLVNIPINARSPGANEQTNGANEQTNGANEQTNGDNSDGIKLTTPYQICGLLAFASLMLCSIKSGEFKKQGLRLLFPQPNIPGPVNSKKLIPSYKGIDTQQRLNTALTAKYITIITGEAGIGKLSTAMNCANNKFKDTNTENNTILTIDYSSYANLEESLQKALLLLIGDTPEPNPYIGSIFNLDIYGDDFDDFYTSPTPSELDKVYSKIIIELLHRQGPIIIIHKRIGIETLENNDLKTNPLINSRALQWLTQDPKHIITSCHKDITKQALTAATMDMSSTATVQDLEDGLKTLVDKLLKGRLLEDKLSKRISEIKKGYGMILMETINHNQRLLVELLPYLCTSKDTMETISSRIKPTSTTTLDQVKENVLKIVTKQLSNKEKQILKLIYTKNDPHQSQKLFHTVRTKYIETGGNKLDFHNTIELLVKLHLIKYDGTTYLYPRIMESQEKYFIDNYTTLCSSRFLLFFKDLF